MNGLNQIFYQFFWKREKLDLKIFLFVINLCIPDSYAFNKKIKDENIISIDIRKFRCQIAFNLILNSADKLKNNNKIINKQKYILL